MGGGGGVEGERVEQRGREGTERERERERERVGKGWSVGREME